MGMAPSHQIHQRQCVRTCVLLSRWLHVQGKARACSLKQLERQQPMDAAEWLHARGWALDLFCAPRTRGPKLRNDILDAFANRQAPKWRETSLQAGRAIE